MGGSQVAAKAPAPAKRWSKSRPYLGTVTALQGLCALREPGDKDTVRVPRTWAPRWLYLYLHVLLDLVLLLVLVLGTFTCTCA